MTEIDTILISHSHDDRLYATELVNLIKVTGIDGKDIKLICSSYPGHMIPGDVLIYDFLREEIKGNVWVIYLLSPSYYNSPACLNEMGATWVLQKKYSTFLVPHFEFSEIEGAIDPSKNGFQLNDKTSLNDFKNILLSEFELQVNDNIWESVRDAALNKFTADSKEIVKRNQMTTVSFESFRRGQDSEKIEIVLRVKNLSSHAVTLNYCEAILKDIDGNEKTIFMEPSNAIIYQGESKLLFIPDDSTSTYSVSKHIEGKIKRSIFQPYYEGR